MRLSAFLIGILTTSSAFAKDPMPVLTLRSSGESRVYKADELYRHVGIEEQNPQDGFVPDIYGHWKLWKPGFKYKTLRISKLFEGMKIEPGLLRAHLKMIDPDTGKVTNTADVDADCLLNRDAKFPPAYLFIEDQKILGERWPALSSGSLSSGPFMIQWKKGQFPEQCAKFTTADEIEFLWGIASIELKAKK